MAQSGSAPALGAGGRRFEPSRPDHLIGGRNMSWYLFILVFLLNYYGIGLIVAGVLQWISAERKINWKGIFKAALVWPKFFWHGW